MGQIHLVKNADYPEWEDETDVWRQHQTEEEGKLIKIVRPTYFGGAAAE